MKNFLTFDPKSRDLKSPIIKHSNATPLLLKFYYSSLFGLVFISFRNIDKFFDLSPQVKKPGEPNQCTK